MEEIVGRRASMVSAFQSGTARWKWAGVIESPWYAWDARLSPQWEALDG
jgi:hypothetical protein